MERLINISMIVIVCVYIVTLNKKRKGRIFIFCSWEFSVTIISIE